MRALLFCLALIAVTSASAIGPSYGRTAAKNQSISQASPVTANVQKVLPPPTPPVGPPIVALKAQWMD